MRYQGLGGCVRAGPPIGGRRAGRKPLEQRLGQPLAELHAPLVEGVYVPNQALTKHPVLVEGEQGAEASGVQAVEHEGVGAVVADGGAMGVLVGPAEGHGLALAQAVGQQPAVVVGQLRAGRLVAVGSGQDEVGGEGAGALVQHLVEGVLPRGALPAPDDRHRVDAGAGAVMADALAVALGFHLLQVVGETPKAVVVGQHGKIGDAQKVDVPDVDQRRQQGCVGCGWRFAEVPVHGVGAVQERLEPRFAQAERHRRADRRPQREPPPDPVP